MLVFTSTKMQEKDDLDSSSRTIAEIVELIRQRGYLPGDRVPSEREFADRMNIGRAQIREAMTMLESMRYLERRPGSGVFLCKDANETSLEALVLFSGIGLAIDPLFNAQCVEVRRMIEVQAIQLACERRDATDIAHLESILAGLSADADAEGGSNYDAAFHLAILKATHNNILVRLMHPFYLMSRHRRTSFFADKKRLRTSHSQHIKMVDAIRRQDAKAAADIMYAHIGRVESYFQ